MSTNCFPRGNNFRPSFEKIGGLRAFTNAPFMALTASASGDIQELVVSSLHLVDPIIVSKNLDRPNIFFSVSAIKDFTVSMVTACILYTSFYTYCINCLERFGWHSIFILQS